MIRTKQKGILGNVDNTFLYNNRRHVSVNKCLFTDSCDCVVCTTVINRSGDNQITGNTVTHPFVCCIGIFNQSRGVGLIIQFVVETTNLLLSDRCPGTDGERQKGNE